MTQILLEKLLASDFTFGFELEAKVDFYKFKIDKNSDEWKSIVEYIENEGLDLDFNYPKTYGEFITMLRDELMTSSNDSDADIDEIIENLLPYEMVKEMVIYSFDFNNYFKEKKYVVAPSKGITYDGSLGPGGFEWRSPVLKLTPDCIIECMGFLQDFKKSFYVDEQCGFHTHIAFNGITSDDAMWLTLKLAMDEDQKNEISELCLFTDPAATKYEPISYENYRYAGTRYLEDLADALVRKEYDKVSALLTNQKYRALRIHPQGTLEWRAPRGFLNEDMDTDYIKSFFLQLHQFVRWMINAMDEKTIEGSDLDRNNLLEMIKSYGNRDNLFKDRMTAGDENIFKKVFDLNASALKNIDKIPTSKLDKAIMKIMRGKDTFEPFMDEFIEHLRYNGDIPDKLFSKVYAFSSPDTRQHLIKAHNLSLLPIKEMVEEHKRIFGRTTDEFEIQELFVATPMFMSDDDIINLLSSGYKIMDAFIEYHIIVPLVRAHRFSNKIKNAIINNGHMTADEISNFIKKANIVV